MRPPATLDTKSAANRSDRYKVERYLSHCLGKVGVGSMRKWDISIAAGWLFGALVIVQTLVVAFESMASPL